MLARALPKRGGVVAAAFLRASSSHSSITTTHSRPPMASPYPYPSIRYLSTTMKPEDDAGK